MRDKGIKGQRDRGIKGQRDRGSDQLPALDPSIPVSLDPFSQGQESKRPAKKDKVVRTKDKSKGESGNDE